MRDKMRLGASDSELLETIGLAVSGKKEKHAGMQDIDVVTNRPMIPYRWMSVSYVEYRPCLSYLYSQCFSRHPHDCSRRKFSNTYTQSMASRFYDMHAL